LPFAKKPFLLKNTTIDDLENILQLYRQ